jgi:hypothetical protein
VLWFLDPARSARPRAGLVAGATARMFTLGAGRFPRPARRREFSTKARARTVLRGQAQAGRRADRRAARPTAPAVAARATQAANVFTATEAPAAARLDARARRGSRASRPPQDCRVDPERGERLQRGTFERRKANAVSRSVPGARPSPRSMTRVGACATCSIMTSGTELAMPLVLWCSAPRVPPGVHQFSPSRRKPQRSADRPYPSAGCLVGEAADFCPVSAWSFCKSSG